MKVLLFSDIHISQHKKSVDRLYDCLRVLEWVFETAKARSITNIIFGGDLFQDRQKIDVITYHLAFDIFAKHCDDSFKLWLLLGNHDLWYHDKWDISSVQPLSALPGVTVINKPSSVDIDGYKIDFMPYTKNPIEHLNLLKQNKNEVLIGHLSCDGAQLNTLHNVRSDVIIEHDGEMTTINADLFKEWKQVWLGHYHGWQKIPPNIEYIGSPLQLSFGEAFQHKYIIVYDLNTGDKEYIKNTFSPQHFIIPEKDISKYDLKNNFIIVEVDDEVETSLIELKKEISKANPSTLSIVPLPKKNAQQVVKDAKAVLLQEDKMLEEYINQVDIGKLDKQLLLDIGTEICNESCGN